MSAKEKPSAPTAHTLPPTVADLLRTKRQAAVAANAAFQEQVSVVLSMLGYAPDEQVRIDFDAGTVTALEAEATPAMDEA